MQWAERRNAEGSLCGALPPSTGPLPSALQTLTMALLADQEKELHPFEGSRAWIRCEDDDAEGGNPESTDRETFAHLGSKGDPARGDGLAGHVDGAALAEAILAFQKGDIPL